MKDISKHLLTQHLPDSIEMNNYDNKLDPRITIAAMAKECKIIGI